MNPPVAKTIPLTYTHLGRTFSDPYAWLQDKDNPQVIAYLEAENSHAQSFFQPLSSHQEALYQELCGRLQENDFGVPEQRGEYDYFWRIQAGQQYRVFYRQHRSPSAPEEIILDENQLAEGHSYCRAFLLAPSPNNHLLVYTVDTTGSLIFDLFIKDLTTGQIIMGPIPQTAWTVAWGNDNQTLFYTVFDASHRSHQLYSLQVGQPASEAILIYHEADESFNLWLRRTRSGEYILLTSLSATTSEVRFLHADTPTNEFQVVQPRRHWHEYYVEHHGNYFIIRSNAGAENFRLVFTPISSPSEDNWIELLPHRSDVLVEDMSTFQNHLVVLERFKGLRCIRISAPDGLSQVTYVPIPDPTYTLDLDTNPEFETPILRFTYSSLVTPRSTVDYEMDQRTWTLRKRQDIPSGYDPSKYTSERLFATAPDGAQVPISLVYRADLDKDGSHPCFLEGYGSYGISNEPEFDYRWLSLLERGFVCAIAHVRGGSELGRAWYENGRLMNKKNTFTDFIACAECLIELGYTSADHLAIAGASAGGLLVSAVTNLRPDLFKAIVARVPFTNVITAMLDPELPLTVIEWEQWGNPNDLLAFNYMLTYSPYENVTAQDYPHILVKTGLNDLQVPYWDPAKWVAKLRSLKTDQNHLLLVTNMSSGHGGSSGRYDFLREVAQIYTFLIKILNAPLELER